VPWALSLGSPEGREPFLSRVTEGWALLILRAAAGLFLHLDLSTPRTETVHPEAWDWATETAHVEGWILTQRTGTEPRPGKDPGAAEVLPGTVIHFPCQWLIPLSVLVKSVIYTLNTKQGVYGPSS
jgi:hypothetical protein